MTWGVVGESVVENGTVDNIESLFKAAKENGIQVFISPHYYYPARSRLEVRGHLEKLMHDINMFDRKDALSVDGFQGSGADWLERYKPYIQDGQTVVVSPHKVYGPETNDLVLQLRKRFIDTVILAGMSANLCDRISHGCASCGARLRGDRGQGRDRGLAVTSYARDGARVVGGTHRVTPELAEFIANAVADHVLGLATASASGDKPPERSEAPRLSKHAAS